jgi:hypothetical protein
MIVNDLEDSTGIRTKNDNSVRHVNHFFDIVTHHQNAGWIAVPCGPDIDDFRS